jgi:D-2-hydroxyacid dehydrogenase (NADP+)
MSDTRVLNVLVFVALPGQAVRYQQLLDKMPGLSVMAVDKIDEARAAVRNADILLAFGANLRPPFFAEASRLKWVNALGTGLDNIVDDASLPPDVVVTATRGIHGVPMSEMAILMMLALARDLPRSIRAQDRHDWERWPGKLLHGTTVGILGVGLIAEELAPRCKAMGMTVVGISRTARPVPGFDRFRDRSDLAAAVAELDHLVLLIPLDDDTRRIVDAKVLAAMKPSATLINLARGGVVDEMALVRALEQRQIGGAAIDTFVQEPLPPEHPLWKAPNVILTPHLGGAYHRYVNDAVAQFTTNLQHFRAGRPDLMANRERPA